MKRAGLLIAAGVAGLIGVTPAHAQRTLYLGAYGGSIEKMVRERIIPPFEKEHNAKVEYVAGQSTATLAKLQAQRGNQELDVIFVDDGPMYQAVELGFCDRIEKSPVLDDLFPIARIDDRALAFSVGATGIVYNEKTFAEKGWPAPTSWADLADPKYKGQIALLGASSTTGLHGLIMAARVNGGGEKDIEPGFTLFKTKIRPNVVTFAPSAPKLAELFQNGEIAMTVWANGRATALRKSGMPVKFVYPKEGGVALMTAVCPVVNSDVPDLAQKFIQHILSPEMQKIFASEGFAPVNRKAKLSPEEAADLPYGEEGMARLTQVDWPTVNQKRGEWTQRWNREVER